MNKDSREKNKKMSRISRLTQITLVFGLIFSAAVFKFTYDHQKKLWEKEFASQAKKTTLIFKNKIEINERILLNILSFYGASQEVDREEFKAFVSPVLERNKFIQALSWVPRISDNNRVEFENFTKKDGFTSFQITERLKQGVMVRAGSRPTYFPVFFIEPVLGNEAAYGFDLASNPIRLSSINESIDTGKLVASHKIQLVQEEEEKEQSAILVLAPFYGNSGIPKNIEERREKLIGLVSGVYRLEDMFKNIISPYLEDGMNLALFEGKEISELSKIFGKYQPNPSVEIKHNIDFYGREWTIVLQGDAKFQNGIKRDVPLVSAVATFSLFLFVSVILQLNHSQTRKIGNEVRLQTHDLMESRARIKAVVDHAIDGIINIDEQGSIESFNPAAEHLFGYTPSEVMGKNVKMLMPEPYTSEHDQYLKNYIETGDSKIIGIGREVVGLRKDGSTFPLDLGISEMYLGETRKFTGIVRDITERKEAEEALHKSKTRVESVLDHAIDGIITIDEQGSIESFNPAAEHLFGYTPSEVMGKNVKMLMPEPYTSEHDQYLKNYIETGDSKIIGIGREVVGLRKDGTTFPLDLGISEMYLGEARMFSGIVRDISKQKEAEEKLEKAYRKNRLILESVGDGIFGLDLEGKATFANPAAEKMLGYTEEELLGKHNHALIHHSRPDGSPYAQDDCHIFASTKDGRVHRESKEVFWRKDGTPLPVEYVSMPIKENDQLVGAVVTFKDTSERQRAERMVNEYTQSLKNANEKLFKSNKELDDFAFIVSHDLKEPLRGIYNYATFVKEDYEHKLDEEGHSKLDTLVRLSQRMESLIDSILYYARLGRDGDIFSSIDLNTVLANSMENMESLIKEANVDVRISKEFPTVNGNETRITEVFQNLIANAIKYNDKPDKWVEVGYIVNGNKNETINGMKSLTNKSPGDHSASPIFYVKDNGIGILEKHFESLFRIFKRLNGKNKYSSGTGAGTTIVKKIIEQHNGKIWLESKVGEGTTFYFTLGGNNGNGKV